jgi:hypothetical protein
MARQLAGIHLVAGDEQGLPAGVRDAGFLTKLRARLQGRSLDRALATGADPAASAVLARRAAWLTSTKNRRALARALRRALEPPIGRGGPSPAVSPHQGELAATRLPLAGVAALLESDDPIYARGVAKLQVLLTEGGSPLYSPRRVGELRREVDSILAALDGREENC